MTPLIAFVFALLKAIPKAESIFTQALSVYSAWKTQQNLNDESAKNTRNAALVADAVASAAGGVREPAEQPPAASDSRG